MNKRATGIFLVCMIIIVTIFLVSYGTARAQDEPQRKDAETCITSKCHAKIGKDAFVHGPIAAGECAVCHGASPKHEKNPGKNKFKRIEDMETLCFSCHEQFEPKKFIHNPVENGECTSCHDPHGSPNKFQLLKKGGELCFECHENEIVGGKYVHGPAAVGGCIACHEPHTSDHEKNLRAKGPELCYLCHTDKAEIFLAGDVVHTPVEEDCILCHNPHSDKEQYMLAFGSPGLCFDCHDDMKEWVDGASVEHAALTTDRACLNCHDAHVSSIAKNLILPTMDLCISCHDREYETENGGKIKNIKKELDENADHHGPIRQKDCSGCHNPHGSSSFRILRNYYPPKFYSPFNLETYNLCFGCHEKTIVMNPETTKLTNFRNAEENLHFMHVNKAEKGRTCRACHETHASNFPKHIRESVPFGTWELPVNFQKTESGGSCTPGCHKTKKYDRVKKVVNP